MRVRASDDVGYKPTLTDVGYARVGYNELTRAINESTGSDRSARHIIVARSVDSPYAPGRARRRDRRSRPQLPPRRQGHRRRHTRRWRTRTPSQATRRPGVGGTRRVVLLLHRRRSCTSRSAARRTTSSSPMPSRSCRPIEWSRRARRSRRSRTINPDKSTPHVFLARLARTDGDLPTAQAELTTAIRLNNGDEKALREMGILLLAQKDYDLARKFLIRAVKADTTDPAAQRISRLRARRSESPGRRPDVPVQGRRGVVVHVRDHCDTRPRRRPGRNRAARSRGAPQPIYMSNIIDPADVHRTVLGERAHRHRVPQHRRAGRGGQHVREGGLLRRDRRRRRHRARARAHVLQGNAERAASARSRRRRRPRAAISTRTRSTITRATTRCCRRAGFDEGLAIQADAYANSVIDAGELARELEVIIQEAMRKEDNAGAVTTETLYALLHERHRIRRWRIGRPSRAAQAHARRSWWRSIATSTSHPTRCSRSRATSIRHATLERVRELYGAIRDHEPVRHAGPAADDHARVPLSRDERRRRSHARGDRMARGADRCIRTPGARSRRERARRGRASRLYRAVRDRGLAGSAGAHNYTPREVGVFMVSSQGRARPGRGRTACDVVAGRRAARRASVARTRSRARKRLFASRWARHLDGVEGQAAHLAEWESLGGLARGEKYYDAFMSLGRRTT